MGNRREQFKTPLAYLFAVAQIFDLPYRWAQSSVSSHSFFSCLLCFFAANPTDPSAVTCPR